MALVYDESIRAVTQQVGSLNDLRGRAATLLSAASIATSFLGAQALSKPGPLDMLGVPTAHVFGVVDWLAIGAFVTVGVISLRILLPVRDWVFTLSARDLIRDYVESATPAPLTTMQRDVALHVEKHVDKNANKIERLFWCFGRVAPCSSSR